MANTSSDAAADVSTAGNDGDTEPYCNIQRTAAAATPGMAVGAQISRIAVPTDTRSVRVANGMMMHSDAMTFGISPPTATPVNPKDGSSSAPSTTWRTPEVKAVAATMRCFVIPTRISDAGH